MKLQLEICWRNRWNKLFSVFADEDMIFPDDGEGEFIGAFIGSRMKILTGYGLPVDLPSNWYPI